MEPSLHQFLRTDLKTPFGHSSEMASGSDRQAACMAWLYRLVRTALAIIFIWSGLAKLMDPRSFSVIIQAYGLIPAAAVMPAALGLSLLELAAGAGLALDMQWSLAAMAGLLILFIAILGYGIWIGLDVDCGCFGPGDPEGKAFHSLRPALYRDMAMLAGTGYLFFWRWRYQVRPLRFSILYQIYLSVRRRK